MRTTGARWAFAVASVATAFALGACASGDGEPTSPLEIGGTPSSDPGSTQPSTPPASAPIGSAGSFRDADRVGNDVYERDVAAKPAGKRAVADAWIAYWEVRSASYGAAEVSPDLGNVATGDALTQVVDYVSKLAASKRYTEGDLVIDIAQIDIDGDTATLRSCMENGSTDRNAAGRPVEALRPYFDTTGSLVRADGAWRVSDLELTTGGPCR